jgi:hypothetical protein
VTDPAAPPSASRRSFSTGLAALWAAWFVGLGAGLAGLSRYAGAPGETAAAPARWPAASGIPRTAGQPTLIMFVHPHCPCSRASLRELEKILARAGGGGPAYVVFSEPPGAEPGWADGDLLRAAAAIPGVEVIADGGGAETRRFGAATSGQVLLYDAGGAEVFRGGITPARAHEGDNAGERAVLSLLTHAGTGAAETPVFGCPL